MNEDQHQEHHTEHSISPLRDTDTNTESKPSSKKKGKKVTLNFSQFDLLEQLPLILTVALIVLTPLIVLPYGENIFKHSKIFFVIFTTLLLVLSYAVNILKRKVVSFVISPFVLPLLLLLGSSLASTFFTSPYPTASLLGFGGAYIAVTIFALLAPTLLKPQQSQVFGLSISTAGVLVSLLTLAELMGYGPSYVFSQAFDIAISANSFNVTGAFFVAAQVLLVSIITSIVSLLQSKSHKLWYIFATLVLIVGLGITTWYSLPGKPTAPLSLPVQESWSIAIDALRSPRIALIGAGPESYSDMYNLFKPASTNTNETIWNVQFNQAFNVPFTIIPTMGLLGLAAWLSLAVQAIRQVKTTTAAGKPALAAIIVILILNLLFPTNIILLAFLAVAIVFWIVTKKESLSSMELRPMTVTVTETENEPQERTEFSQSFVYSVVAVLLLAVILSGFFASQAYASFYYLFLSERAATNNDIVNVYNFQQKAIEYNPYMSLFRRRYALTNLAIATALSNKEQPTQEDAQQVQQLVEQAIREGRASTTINPTDTQNWRALGDVYRNLIGVAEGAENWALASYSRAIETAPTDPTVRIQLGGIFYGQEEYQQAVTLFSQAAQLKPDYANAYYNLANAYAKLGNYVAAAQSYQQTLALLEPGSEDYQQAQKELEEIRPQAEQQAQELQAAQQNAPRQPNQNNATPTPTPTPTVNATQEQFRPEEETINPDSVELNPGTEEQLNPGENQPQQESPTPTPTPSPNP